MVLTYSQMQAQCVNINRNSTDEFNASHTTCSNMITVMILLYISTVMYEGGSQHNLKLRGALWQHFLNMAWLHNGAIRTSLANTRTLIWRQEIASTEGNYWERLNTVQLQLYTWYELLSTATCCFQGGTIRWSYCEYCQIQPEVWNPRSWLWKR